MISGWTPFMTISGTNIPAGSYITSILSSSSIAISQSSTATGSGVTVTVGAAWIQVSGTSAAAGAMTSWTPYPSTNPIGTCGYIALPSGVHTPYDALTTSTVSSAGSGATISVAWGFPTYADGSLTWGLRANAFNRSAQSLTALSIDSCSNMYFDVEGINVARLVELTPRGSNDMSSHNLSFINPRGWNITSDGFIAVTPFYPGTAVLDGIRILQPDIHVTGSGGKVVNVAGAYLNVVNFEIQGGILEATGSSSYGLYFSPTKTGPSSFSGRIGGDAQIRATLNPLYMITAVQSPGQDEVISLALSSATFEVLGSSGGNCMSVDGTSRTVPSGTYSAVSGSGVLTVSAGTNTAWLPGAAVSGPGLPSGATISSVGATSVTISQSATMTTSGATTIGNLGSVDISADGPINLRNAGGGYAGYSATNGAVVQGRFCRGISAATPTVPGEPGEFFLAATPTSTFSGWIYTTTAGVSAWTPYL
jgi:hypothetical protein